MPKKAASGGGASKKKSTVRKTAKKAVVRKVSAKKAVKKTTKKTAKEVAKKTTKKTTTTRKTSEKKFVKKKSVSQKLPVRKETKAETETRNVALEHLFKKSPVRKEDKEIEPVTVLPTNASVRSVRKAFAIKHLLSDSVAEKVRKGAYGLSFAFLLLGATYSVFSLSADGLKTTQNAANIIDSTTGAVANSVPVIEPSFTVEPKIPAEITSEAEFRLTILEAQLVNVILVHRESGNRKILGTQQMAATDYSFLVPSPEALKEGKHDVRVVVENSLGVKYDKTLGSFVVTATSQTIANTTTVATSNTNTDTSTTAATTPTDEEEVEVETSNPETVETVTEAVVPPVTRDTVTGFALQLSATDFTDSRMLLITVPKDVSDLSLYAKREASYTPQFIGKARKDDLVWRMYLDIANLPNGKYELFAKGTRAGFDVESKTRLITINKPPLETTTRIKELSNTADTTQDTATATKEILTRDFSALSLSPEISQNIESEQIVTELLRSEKSELEILLRNYSVAVQSQDETAIRLATEALDAKKVYLRVRGSIETASVITELDNRIQSLRSRIETFEELRRSKNDRRTSVDTDGDGISDYDEQALFKTDPENPDTDEDGITDGIEIMRGFNPRIAAAEATIMYESPKETVGLVRGEDLRVRSVSPYVEIDEENANLVQTVIEGEALPNSYVNIYIYSTPTIVTVKTDDTGAFSYTFSKELEDGSHEVYVAMTDNTGAIIAQSEPFSFVKRAEAFTAGASTESGSVIQTPSQENTYALALGLGILALGLVLLMLGIGLRKPELQAIST